MVSQENLLAAVGEGIEEAVWLIRYLEEGITAKVRKNMGNKTFRDDAMGLMERARDLQAQRRHCRLSANERLSALPRSVESLA